MEFEKLLTLVSRDPVFETGLLLSGRVDAGLVRQQLSRWVKSGRVLQLRRGIYALADPYRKVDPHPFHIANVLQHASYVSCQAALAYDGLIPEGVHTITSITAGRPEVLDTPFGTFEYRHVKPALFCSYRQVTAGGQRAFIATPEKALLDLIYLQPEGDSPAYLRELRLQNLEQLRPEELQRLANEFGLPKLHRAVKILFSFMEEEAGEYKAL